jgi:hypothetical protein
MRSEDEGADGRTGFRYTTARVLRGANLQVEERRRRIRHQRSELVEQRVEDVASPEEEVVLDSAQQLHQRALGGEMTPQKQRGSAVHA